MSASIKDQADRFAVWRMGTVNTWECSYQEAAEATGLTVAKVKRICVANGWRFQDDQGEFEEVDSFMDRENAVDVPQIHV